MAIRIFKMSHEIILSNFEHEKPNCMMIMGEKQPVNIEYDKLNSKLYVFLINAYFVCQELL